MNYMLIFHGEVNYEVLNSETYLFRTLYVTLPWTIKSIRTVFTPKTRYPKIGPKRPKIRVSGWVKPYADILC
jgi:hypothetical protein